MKKAIKENFVTCGLCGEPTASAGTRLCDGCWELDGRVGRDPELAAAVLRATPYGAAIMRNASGDLMDVFVFHRRFGLPAGREFSRLPDEWRTYRLGFLREELQELREAVDAGDATVAADSLVDLAYVALGTALFCGNAFSHPWETYSAETAVANARGLGYSPGEDKPWGLLCLRIAEELGLLDVLLLGSGGSSEYAVMRCLRRVVGLSHVGAGMLGMPWDACWNEVQRANMSKARARRDGSDSKRGSGWDVVKPPGWQSPDPSIKAILAATGASL